MTKRIVFVLFSLVLFTSGTTFGGSIESIEGGDPGGGTAVLGDGAVVCRIYDNLQRGNTAGSEFSQVVLSIGASGIDCKFERDGYRPDEKQMQFSIQWTTDASGSVIRRAVGKKICYIYSRQALTASMSCP